MRYTRGRRHNHLSSSRFELGTTTTWRCSDPKARDRWFWCKENFGRSRQLNWPSANLGIWANGALILSLRESRADIVRIQQSVNNIPRRCCVTCPSWSGHLECTVLCGGGSFPFQCHYGTHVASRHEGHPIHISSNGELPHWRRAYRPFW